MQKQIGQRIWDRRQQLGLTQRQLAKASGLQQYQIVELEYGDRDFRISTLAKISKGLKIPLAKLLGGLD